MTTVFDISAERAMFRKPYTTTSSQSFSFPPPSTVAGIISAILGFRNDSDKVASNAHYWHRVKGTRIAIKMNRAAKWETHSLNYINTKSGNRSIHTQIKHQFLKCPSFRIFVQGSLEQMLSKALENERYVFTPYLGVVYAIADVKYIGRFEERNSDSLQINSIIPFETEQLGFNINKNNNLNISDVPFEFTPDRTLKTISRVVYRLDAKPVYLKNPCLNAQKVGEDSVLWFPYW